MNQSANDIVFMREALRLAESMRGRTSPDPLVGAVLVKDGQILATGYHAEVTTPHAEAWAIQKAISKYGPDILKEATLYVNLEPCCFFHEKVNPPCTQAIIEARLSRVVIAMEDPNPSVAGKGIAELKNAGMQVEVGLLEGEAKKLNEIFIKHITTQRPFVLLKTAMSLDGKIAAKTGESFWITGIEARKRGHRLRNTFDAVLVGINTVLKDNPELTVREIDGKIKNPKKIILDPKARIPLDSKVLENEPENAIVAVGPKAAKSKINKIKALGAGILEVKFQKGVFSLDTLMKDLYQKKITSLLIEGGGNTNAHALSQGIVDKVNFFVAPKIIGGKTAPTAVEGKGIDNLLEAIKLKDVGIEKVGDDLLIEAYVLR